uniref:C-type lectin domain-containing protein n=1 Tax=Oryzias latipes TaxID=8090 RepID=A0A3P9JLH8_ORYLA
MVQRATHDHVNEENKNQRSSVTVRQCFSTFFEPRHTLTLTKIPRHTSIPKKKKKQKLIVCFDLQSPPPGNLTCIFVIIVAEKAGSCRCFSKRFTDQNKKKYVFINQAMSWSSAQQYCRKNYKDLAMIENQEENTEAQNAKPYSDLVWIGLYREPWTWSDGSKSSFRDWYPTVGLNNFGGNRHCGTENYQHDWSDEDCRIKRVFVCHQGENLKKY